VKAVETSAAVLESTARSAAIFGISGSTARVNSVEEKTARLTMGRTEAMAGLVYLSSQHSAAA
jgi:hypothetical protein